KMKKNIVKRLAAASLAALTALGMTGCSGSSDKKESSADGISGKVVIYTSMYQDIIDNMKEPLKKKFPDLDIEFFQAGSGTIQSKLAAELDSGKLSCDLLMVAEPSYSMELKEKNVLHAYDYADKDKLAFDYDKDGCYYPVRVCNMVLAYNPEKYKKDEVPTSFKAFAEDSSFKGDISMTNPLSSGTAYSAVVSLLDKYGEDYFKALGKQDVAIESGSVALTKLETGECKAIMVLEESVLKKREEEGSSLEVIYPEEGSIAIPSNIMIVDGKYSANNNIKAAEAVEEFFLSPEGQELIVKGWMYGVRSDLSAKPYDGIELADLVKQTLPVDWEKAYKDIEKIRTMFQEYVTIPEK
ncbi:MAG: ABC transporter substrate-binding protein, partial [Lachnospiraceae bacterium]|nr:ABC transporter substrate-binding protein [Lachnospiraceae bacterium]